MDEEKAPRIEKMGRGLYEKLLFNFVHDREVNFCKSFVRIKKEDIPSRAV